MLFFKTDVYLCLLWEKYSSCDAITDFIVAGITVSRQHGEMD